MALKDMIDEGIDLMLCGAYGHARWREIVLAASHTACWNTPRSRC
jgi:hypothetical protein